MKKNIYIALATLVMFVLTACQAAPATPAGSKAVEFFTNQAGRWTSVKPPTGWVAKLGGSTISPSIIMTDNWEGYQKADGKAIGITVLPLTDKGSAEQVLKIAIERLKNSLTQPAGKITLEQVAGQSYASVEYNGIPVEAGGTSSYYFLAVIAIDQRSVLVFTSCAPNQQELIRPAFQNALKAITLH